MPDDVGFGDYTCLSNPIVRTPQVDAFKKQSVLLTQFHLSPTCSPCRSALMSGRHAFKNGVTHTTVVASLRAAYDQWWTDVQGDAGE